MDYDFNFALDRAQLCVTVVAKRVRIQWDDFDNELRGRDMRASE